MKTYKWDVDKTFILNMNECGTLGILKKILVYVPYEHSISEDYEGEQ
jgi:hypothetical protein